MLRKRMTALLLAVLLSASPLPARAAAPLTRQETLQTRLSEAGKTGWKTRNGKRYYLVNGEQKTGKTRVGNHWYYFDPEMKTGLIRDEKNGTCYFANKNGILQTGWKTVGSDTYYFWAGTSGRHKKYEAATGKRQVNGTWYLFGKNGALLYGLNEAGGKLYYTDAKGRLQTGFKSINGKKYYFKRSGDEQGAAYIGFKTIKDRRYYFGPEAKTGLFKKKGSYYYADSGGVLQTGWKTIKGRKYYFWKNSKGHKLYEAATGKVSLKDRWRLFSGKGVLLTGLNTVDGKTYYSDGKGLLQTGWQTVDGKKYYFDKKTFEALTGKHTISDRGYVFDDDGSLKKEEPVTISSALAFYTTNNGGYRIVDGVHTCRGIIQYIGYDQHKWEKNIDGSGCGLCSFLTVISTFKGRQINADDYKATKLEKISGASKCPISFFAGVKMLEAEGIRYEWVKVISKTSNTEVYKDILSHLKKGMPVIVALSPKQRNGIVSKEYTNSGHFATLIGVVQDGKKAYLLDSGGRTPRYVDLNDICWCIPTAQEYPNADPIWNGWDNTGGYIKVYPKQP